MHTPRKPIQLIRNTHMRSAQSTYDRTNHDDDDDDSAD